MDGAEPLGHGEVVEAGELHIEALRTPGHTRGMLSFVVDGQTSSRATLSSRGRSAAPRRASTTFAARSWTSSWACCTSSSSTPATARRRRSAGSGTRTRSSASGVGSSPRHRALPRRRGRGDPRRLEQRLRRRRQGLGALWRRPRRDRRRPGGQVARGLHRLRGDRALRRAHDAASELLRRLEEETRETPLPADAHGGAVAALLEFSSRCGRSGCSS